MQNRVNLLSHLAYLLSASLSSIFRDTLENRRLPLSVKIAFFIKKTECPTHAIQRQCIRFLTNRRLSDQVDVIKERLKVDETGEPAIYFLRDRLVHDPAPDLKDAYRPTEVTDELLSCVYDEKLRYTHKNDEAIIGDNHGIDSTGYLAVVDRSCGA